MKHHSRTVRVYAGYSRLRSLIAAVCVALTLCAVSCSGDSAIQKGQEYRTNNPPEVNNFHAYNADGSEIDAGRIEPFSVYNLYVSASDKDRDTLSYSFNSVSGSFSEVVSNAAGCSAVFKTGNISGGQDVVVELTVTDKKGGTARSKLSVGSGKLGPTIIINYDKNKIRPNGDVTLTVSANCSGLFQVKPNADNAITAGNLSSAVIDFSKDMMIYSATDNATTTVITGPTSGTIGNILLPSKPEYKDDTVYNVVLVFLDGLNQRDAVICPIAVDGTAPSVQSHSPLEGSIHISTSPDISITFSESVANIDDTLLSLAGGNVGPIVRKSYNGSTNTVVYAVSGLDHDKEYTAIIKDAKDALGNPMTVSKTFSFTTSPVYVLTYYGNNNTGGVVPASGQYVLNTNAVVSGNTGNLVKTGYTFAGWSVSSTATAADYTSGQTINMTGNVSLYAVWTPKQYTVTFDPKGGTMSFPSPITVTYGLRYEDCAGWPSDVPIKTGYSFAGWWLSSTYSSGTQISASTTVTTDTNHTVYAKWVNAPVVVTFNSQGGSSVSAKSCTPGTAYGTLGTPTFAGHNFSGWYTEAAEGTGNYITEVSIVSNTSAHTLYAHWDAAPYFLRFNNNGGPGTSPGSILVYYGGQYPVLPVPPLRDKYTFAGWFTDATAGSQIQAGNTINITSDTWLYAHWIENLVTSITLDKTTVYTSYGVGTTVINATVNGNPLNGAITWASSNPSLATVNSAGSTCTVTVLPYNSQTTDQTVTITATALDGSGKEAVCTIVIQPELPISGKAGLEIVRNNLGGRFKLTGDIDLESADWTPIGLTDAAPFAGCFDGNGYTISRLKIDNTGLNNCGLFGVNIGAIKNLRVNTSSINGGQYCGIIAGKNKRVDGSWFGVIEKCIAGSGDQSTGGGEADPNCTVTGSAYVGGLVGLNEGNISKCQSYANVVYPLSEYVDVYVGGFVGYNIQRLEYCCAFGNVNAPGGLVVGGFVGLTQGTIVSCYSRGAVTGYANCGGFVGKANLTNISSSYHSFGNVTVTDTPMERDYFAGEIVSSIILNCYVTNQGSAAVPTANMAIPRVDTDMKYPGTYTGWTFGTTSVWKINSGSSYPYLNQDLW